MANDSFVIGEPCEGIRYLSVENLEYINSTLIRLQTPSEPSGVLKPNELMSSQQRPAQYRSYSQNNDIFVLVSRLMSSIVWNHSFHNANKRTAAAAGAIFLLLNGFELTGPGDELIDILVGLSTGEYTEDELECWLADWSREYNASDLNSSIHWAIAIPAKSW